MKTFIFLLFTALAFSIITWVTKTTPTPEKNSYKYGFPKTFVVYDLPEDEYNDGDTHLDIAAFLLDVMCAMPFGWAASFAIGKLTKKNTVQ